MAGCKIHNQADTFNMKIKKEIVEESFSEQSIKRFQYYTYNGLERYETRQIQTTSDFNDIHYERYSPDNGKTWGQWQVINEAIQRQGSMEMMNMISHPFPFDPKPNVFIKVLFRRIFLVEHKEAYSYLWNGMAQMFYDHAALLVSVDYQKTWREIPIKYEAGSDFNPYRWCDMDYLIHNQAYFNAHISNTRKGNIVFSIGIPVKKGCELLKLDCEDIFPSHNNITMGQMLVTGHWNENANQFDLSYSNPIVISEKQSSVGLQESNAIELKDGTIYIEARGCNQARKQWNQTMPDNVKGYKWFSVSTDGGKTISEVQNLKYDTGEEFFSPESMSKVFRWKNTGKLYWLGNLHDSHVSGMFPRAPLYIAEIDEEKIALKKDTLTIIDERQPDESERLQLSNFSILENTQTGEIEIYLSKIGKIAERPFMYGHAMKYTIDL